MYRCDDHGVTVVVHDTDATPQEQLQLDRVETQLDQVASEQGRGG